MTLTFSVIGRGALTGPFTKSLRLTATRCDGVGFLMRELNAKSPRASAAAKAEADRKGASADAKASAVAEIAIADKKADKKKGRILLEQKNSSGEWEPWTLSV